MAKKRIFIVIITALAFIWPGTLLIAQEKAVKQTTNDAAATQKPAKTKPSPPLLLTIEQAIAIGLKNTSSGELDNLRRNNLTKNKQLLESFNVASYRLDSRLKKIDGKTDTLATIPSPLYERPNVLGVLNALINQQQKITQTQNNKPYLFSSDPIIQRIHQVYWPAVAAETSSTELGKLLIQTRQMLSDSMQKNSTSTPLHQKQLLQLMTRLKQQQLENEATRQQLFNSLGIKKTGKYRLPKTVKNKLSIPKIRLNADQFNQAITANNAKPENEPLYKKAQQHLKIINPKLSFDWDNQRQSMQNAWISTGKYIAFDLNNHLDQLERFKILKQKTESQQEQYDDIAGSLTGAHLAYGQYLKNLEAHEMAYCVESLSDRLETLESQNTRQDTRAQINMIKRQLQNIENFQHRIRIFANLQISLKQLQIYLNQHSDFSELISKPVTDIVKHVKIDNRKYTAFEALNDKACYAPEQKKKTVTPVIRKIEPAKTIKKTPVAKPLPKKVVKQSWISEQNPQDYALQVLSSKDRKTVERYIKKYDLGNKAQILQTKSGNKPYYSLIYGVYKDQESAYIGQFKLPDNVLNQNQIWVRKVSDLQKNAR